MPQKNKNIRQRDKEGRHQSDFERHEEWGGDIGGDHLPAFGQSGQQRVCQQSVEV
jgi:hypothetical protein